MIYIPGVGDRLLRAQRLLVKHYPLLGVKPEWFQVNWSDNESYDQKQARLIAYIQELRGQGKTVSLLAFSAGASLAVSTYVAQPELIHKIVFISGKLQGSVNPRYYELNPAFRAGMERLPAGLTKLTASDKAKMRTIGSPFDLIVPLRDAVIPGVKRLVLPSIGHGGTLICATVFGGWPITHFIKGA